MKFQEKDQDRGKTHAGKLTKKSPKKAGAY